MNNTIPNYLYNVANTSDDKTDSGKDWIDALEEELNIKIPNKQNLVGGHLSRFKLQSEAHNTEYIGAITPEENNKSNMEPIRQPQYIALYSRVKKH